MDMSTTDQKLQVADDERRHHDEDDKLRIDEAKRRSQLLIPAQPAGV
jgi:hypothetical protein